MCFSIPQIFSTLLRRRWKIEAAGPGRRRRRCGDSRVSRVAAVAAAAADGGGGAVARPRLRARKDDDEWLFRCRTRLMLVVPGSLSTSAD